MGLAARVVLPGAFIFDLPMRPPPNICENLHKWELGSGVWSVPSTQSSYAWRITLLRVYTAKKIYIQCVYENVSGNNANK